MCTEYSIKQNYKLDWTAAGNVSTDRFVSSNLPLFVIQDCILIKAVFIFLPYLRFIKNWVGLIYGWVNIGENQQLGYNKPMLGCCNFLANHGLKQPSRGYGLFSPIFLHLLKMNLGLYRFLQKIQIIELNVKGH